MSNQQSTLDDFGERLSNVQADTQLEWAVVDSAEVMPRESAYSDVMPFDDGAKDEGIEITFQLASGRRIELWYEEPTEWTMMNDLVMLLEYWQLHSGDIERLDADEEEFEIPIDHDDSIGDFRPDWPEIERTIQTREKAKEIEDGSE